jgi:hypothetical protein
MPTLLNRLIEMYAFGVPMRTEFRDRVKDFPQVIVQEISRTEQEIIVPDSKKYQMFGHLSQKFNGNLIPETAQRLSNACSNRQPPESLYSRDKHGFSSLSLDKVDCHAVYDSYEDITVYFLLPRSTATDLEPN